MFRRLEAVEREAGVRPPRSVAARAAGSRRVIAAASVATASASPPAGKAPTFAAACGTKPVTMEGYFETGFPAPDRADERVHAAVPEREVAHPPGPVRSDHAERTALAVGAESA